MKNDLSSDLAVVNFCGITTMIDIFVNNMISTSMEKTLFLGLVLQALQVIQLTYLLSSFFLLQLFPLLLFSLLLPLLLLFFQVRISLFTSHQLDLHYQIKNNMLIIFPLTIQCLIMQYRYKLRNTYQLYDRNSLAIKKLVMWFGLAFVKNSSIDKYLPYLLQQLVNYKIILRFFTLLIEKSRERQFQLNIQILNMLVSSLG